jgi:hypothetical protein
MEFEYMTTKYYTLLGSKNQKVYVLAYFSSTKTAFEEKDKQTLFFDSVQIVNGKKYASQFFVNGNIISKWKNPSVKPTTQLLNTLIKAHA